MTPQRLALRTVGWQVGFTAATALAVHFLVPFLFLLSGEQGKAASLALSVAILVAGSLSVAHGWSLVWARRRLLSSLVDKQHQTSRQIEIPKLNDDPWHIVNGWLYSATVAVTLAMTALRPDAIAPSSALTLGLFSIIVQAAASLPLLMFVRRDFVRVMEQVPPDIMAEIIDAQVRSGHLRGRTSRRLLAALATPVAFLSIGSALIVGAHLRSLEEAQRQNTARTIVGAVLSSYGGTDTDIKQDSTFDSLSSLSKAGYQVNLRDLRTTTEVVQTSQGVVDMLLPLGTRSAEVRFYSTTNWAISWPSIPLTLLALLAASWIGLRLARLLSGDLRMANRGVRMLGTDAALEGTRVMQPARFQAIAVLGTAIELLAKRFRLFATAQQQSISARKSATKARGRFFASVSHDLKSPLNAILGFAELTRRDPLTNSAQMESLEMIILRGKELLILIETILDAARVEAGQLNLERRDEDLEELLELSLEKAIDLSADVDVLTRFDFQPDLPTVTVDRLRLSQAIATFLAHARRTSDRESLRVFVQAEAKSPTASLKKREITIHIEVPSTQFSAKDLESMIRPEQHPGRHRGLSLALRLARSLIELHGGRVAVTGRTVTEPAFAIYLEGRAGR